MRRVQVKNLSCKVVGTECFVDGVKIPHVRAVDFHVGVNEAPVFTFETVGNPDIDMPGQVEFSFKPLNVSEACQILSQELKKHGDFYDAFVASVRSAIEEIPSDVDVFEYEQEISEKIVKRISGEE